MASANTKRDTFFWLGQINKSTAVINTSQGLLDASLAPPICRGLQAVLDAGRDGGPRPSRVITFEPVLIQAAGVEATLLHAGRSSQDMHTTATTAQLREDTLDLADQLLALIRCLVDLAEQHSTTLVPSYTNGVAAQPNSYGHYLLGQGAGFSRDADRLQEFYKRLDLSPMGTTVLNGTGWPLDRARMAAALGFAGVVDNAYDAAQIRCAELPVEMGSVTTSIALHIGTFVQDVMVQYSQPRPWILLEEGGDNTYVSSAMPQKRNPGLLNDTRAEASRLVTLGVGRTLQAHNIPSGMTDTRSTADNEAVLRGAASLVVRFMKVLRALNVNATRALEELNLDWTASQELADVLMRDHGIPFRVGHHFASDVVSFAKSNGITPADFSLGEAQCLYTMACTNMGFSTTPDLPLDETAFRAALDPASIVKNRKTSGGPQPEEMTRMIARHRAASEGLAEWVCQKRRTIDDALARVDADFAELMRA